MNPRGFFVERMIALILVIIVSGSSYYLWRSLQREAPNEAPIIVGSGEVVKKDFKNSSYEVNEVRVQLTNGLSEVTNDCPPGYKCNDGKTVTRYFGNEAKGDFNADGTEDVAFILTQTSGGSGTFYYVVAALKNARGFQGTNAILLGDRIAPQTTEFRDGQITVNYADRRLDEPMVAKPTVGVSRYFVIENQKLVERKQEVSQIQCPPVYRHADVCADIYAPVCATVNVQCVKAPCYPVKQTFSNSCEACRNPLIPSYVAGACK